jgi:murein DD-endopeptidase MepM/ murein hydrolase activator NlpD
MRFPGLSERPRCIQPNCRQGFGRSASLSRFVVALALIVSGAFLVAPRAQAAGVNQYSAPEWLPLHSDFQIGCTYNSPGAICGGTYHPYQAIDMLAPRYTPVYAAGAGFATISSSNSTCGGSGTVANSIKVDHSGGVTSYYYHLDSFNIPAGGAWVDENTVIGLVGSTGYNIPCPTYHLHYEKRVNGVRVDAGQLKACHGGSLVTYPAVLRGGDWTNFPGHQFRAHSDGTACGSTVPNEGSFVSATDNGEVYRIVGGAPIYVSSWSVYGTPQPTIAVSRAQIDAMPLLPADGTFVDFETRVYRIVGGAPIYVSSWDVYGGIGQPSLTIDPVSVANAGAGSPWNHLRKYPLDGSFVDAGGSVLRMVGGAPIPVSNWANVGGPFPVVKIDPIAVQQTDGGVPWDHMRTYPADGSFVDAGGTVFRIVGGAPIAVSTWAVYGGAQPVVRIDPVAIANAGIGGLWNHLRQYPVDGTFVGGGATHGIEVVVGGAPLYISNTYWQTLNPKPLVWEIDPAAITNAGTGGVWNHLRQVPVDGTFVRADSGVFVIAGGAPQLLSFDYWQGLNPKPSLTQIDPAAITNAGLGVPWNHLAQYPVDGTVLAAAGKTYRVMGGIASVVAGLPGGVAVDPLVIANAGLPAPWNHLRAQPVVVELNLLSSPVRLLDTRVGGVTVDALFAGLAERPSGTTTELQIGGRGGLPGSVSSVVLTVTVTGASGAGFLTVFPCGVVKPNVSSVNYVAGDTVANVVVVGVGSTGKVCLFNQGGTHLIADVTGYLPSASMFTPLPSPVRLLDTRAGGSTIDGLSARSGPLAANAILTVPVSGRGGVPSTARFVALTVTVTDPAADGYVTVFPCDQTPPNASNLNFVGGQTIANTVLTRLSATGTVCLRSSAPTQILADVTGYFVSGVSALGAPTRFADSRVGGVTVDGSGQGFGIVGAGSTTVVQIGGRGGVASSASKAVLTITVTGGTGAGYLTVFPCDQPKPGTSNLNFKSGQTIAATTISRLSATGSVCIFSSAQTHLITDITATLN